MPTDELRGVAPLRTVGDYDLLSKIADGGMGSVYKARNNLTNDIVAIKIVPANMANNTVLLRRFEQEFKAASTLDHPNIVRALDFGYDNASPYLVMEYVDGETLGQKIDHQGRLPEKEAVRIIAQIAQGLHKAHSHGMVHRDVKPDNILIRPDGVSKIADLGLVKENETDLNLTRTGRGLGTPQFMAPEQFRNAKNADSRCDIYSLAATLYMAVTGELPFRSCSPLDAWMKKVQNDYPPPRELNPHLSERLDWAIRRAMSADPMQRPATCREFVEDISGRSTRRVGSNNSASGQNDLWYIVYSDEFSTTHTVKGTMQSIRRCFKEGRLGDANDIRVSRFPAGPFEQLRTHPEFRDLVIVPVAVPLLTPLSGTEIPRAENTGPGSGSFPKPSSGVFAGPGSGSMNRPKTPPGGTPRTPPPRTPHSGVMIQPGVSQDAPYSSPSAYHLQKFSNKPRGDLGLVILLSVVMFLGFVVTLAVLYYLKNQ
ncbi:MAG TPA: serine/threonine-protein kinase [Gemmatales bacterium]|nr:serine/threonine-protein kinase [Gemmatales bacterium]